MDSWNRRVLHLKDFAGDADDGELALSALEAEMLRLFREARNSSPLFVDQDRPEWH